MIEAQKPEYWSEEGCFQAMRSALLSYLEAEDGVLRRQKKRFVKFQGNVDTAAEAFTAAEAGNQEELAQGGAPSAPTPAPSPITGATPPASATQAPPGGPSATPPAGASGAPSGAAPGTAPVQNLPSDI